MSTSLAGDADAPADAATTPTQDAAVLSDADSRESSPAHPLAPHPAADPNQVIGEHLALGKALLARGAFVAAQEEFRAILRIDATHRDALRLMTTAQQRLEAEQAKAAHAQAKLRQQAQTLALKLAREKADAQAAQEAKARTQLARAREQELKLLYTKGLSAYRRGAWQDAIEMLQQMVLLDPAHPLVQEAQRLITRAETKQAEARARASARLSPKQGPAAISELEQQLTAKRIEVETVLKYAKVANKDHNYAMAIELLQRVLTQDPQNREAQHLLEETQLAKLKDEEAHLTHQVERDEQSMVNEVMKAQVLPEERVAPIAATAPPAPAASAMAAKLQQPISLDFTDVALADVLEFIGDAASVSIIPSPKLDLKSRRVSLKVTQLPLEQALKYLAKNQALAYRVESDAILIATAAEFSGEPVQTRVFLLRNGLSPFSLETAALEPNPALAMQSMKELMEKAVPQPPESKFVIDQRSGALIVTNTPENLEQVAHLLSQLDITPVQVLIEARFIELTMTDLEQLGLESVLTGDYTLDKGRVTSGKGPGQIVAKSSGFKFPDLSRQDEGVNLTVEGVLTGLQFESVLHALEETKKSKTLSAPRVTTLNNQTAQIRVVEEFNYPTKYEVKRIQFDINGDGDFDDAGETEFANVPSDLKSRDVGILLHVTPSVGRDLKTITLVLAPEVSQFGQFRDLGGGVTVPEFTSSQVTTSVVIEDGQTVMMGGLMKDTTTEQSDRIPFLGDLPMVGGLFRQTRQTSARKNLLIFITARLLAPRGPTT